MNYIKTYEELYDRRSNNNEIYHEGDYVQINTKGLGTNNTNSLPFIGKIIAIDHVYAIVDADPYHKSVFSDDLIIYSDRIIRNATPEEIKQYELEKKMSKYNL